MALFKSMLATSLCLAFGIEAGASSVRFLPNETFNVPDQRKQEFARLIERVLGLFQDVAQSHGARITHVINWDSSGYGAFTLRKDGGKTWEIYFYDGILKLPFANDDVITVIACHEIGHHLAGYPFSENGWSAAEGQADYFSVHACLPRVWRDETETNRSFRIRVNAGMKEKCDAVFAEESRRDICYRTAVAMESLLLYEGYGAKNPPKLDTPDKTKVKQTFLGHSKPQCRVDTELAGMFCNLPFDYFYIPGHLGKGTNTVEAENDSNRYICSKQSGNSAAARPSCWFASMGEAYE